jgi:anti-sigma-K factor RskA
MSEHDHFREDVPAYMLGALDPEQAQALERHAESCEACRSEIRWMQAAVEALPETVERRRPPPALRERLLAEVRAEALPQAEPEKAAPRRRFAGLLGGRGLTWRPLAGLAALALVVVAFAGYEIGSGGGGGTPQTTTYAAGKAPGVTAKVVRTGDAAELKLANVAELPENHVLEAWVQRDGEIEPVKALFVPNKDGSASTTIANMRNVEVVMVTREPAGGTEAPTSTPIATVPITSS